MTFWTDGATAKLPPLTDDAVAHVQQALGVHLPTSLLDLLRQRNGGTVARHVFPTTEPTSWSDDHIPFDELLGIRGGPGSGLAIDDSPYLVEEWELPSPAVLLSGDGHTWVGLDYRVCGPTGEPSVSWFDADAESELPLAPDFPTFVEGLTEQASCPSA